LTRFLPPTPVRLLLDLKGTNLAPQVEFESFNRQLNAINRHNASKLVNAVQKEVHAILQQSEPLVEAQARELIEKAKKEADEVLSAELSRLEALKAVNPNIRDDELSAIESEHKNLLLNLDQANWRLDAIRLVVVSHQ
ncbi:RNA polymerase-associated protein RapA, partial [Xenorhabdus sp. M]|nr:RNA polymerase-associated protein RapA [Xenorhabdus sp. M]